jgi:hypothetical protein
VSSEKKYVVVVVVVVFFFFCFFFLFLSQRLTVGSRLFLSCPFLFLFFPPSGTRDTLTYH